MLLGRPCFVLKDLIAGWAVPAGLGDAGVISIVRLLKQRAELDGPTAANVEAADRHRCTRMHWRSAGESPELFARDAPHVRADIPPAAVLNPEAGTMAVLNINSEDRHCFYSGLKRNPLLVGIAARLCEREHCIRNRVLLNETRAKLFQPDLRCLLMDVAGRAGYDKAW